MKEGSSNKNLSLNYFFMGKRFKTRTKMLWYKNNVFPKVLSAIRKQYVMQKCQENGISRDEWRRYCLVHFVVQNLGHLYPARIGYLAIRK